MIPYVGTFKRGLDFAGKALGFDGPKGPPSDRARYATDNGFAGGQGLGRDEFGVYTGGKTMLGKTANYQERIGNRIGELESFFSKKGIDLDDPNLDIDKMKSINGFYTKQYFAYKNRQATDKINKDYAAKLESDRKAKAAAEERAKQIAANRIQAANQQNNTGGYQSSWSGNNDFMGGGDRGTGNNPDDKGGSDSMGSFARGGSVRKYFKGGIVSLRGR
jgi:hypothetical protein